jgi:hypothetical protein
LERTNSIDTVSAAVRGDFIESVQQQQDAVLRDEGVCGCAGEAGRVLTSDEAKQCLDVQALSFS